MRSMRNFQERRCGRWPTLHDGRARETREKGKMEIFNEEATRGIHTANFASVRVFSGG